jgi:hypothetical protein
MRRTMLHSFRMEKPVVASPLHEFFLRMTRRSFDELGLGDQAVVCYVAAVLTEFARTDRLYSVRNERGRAVDEVREMRGVVARSGGDDQRSRLRARAIQKYVGDYTLFMTGLFRTHVESRGALDIYVAEGQRSYRAVSELDLTMFRTGFLFFAELAKNFEHYSEALDYMRRAYFTPQPGESPFAEFLQRVEGWIKGGLSDN